MFGHPDGKQEFSQGIGLPSWVIEKRNVWWVMGAYTLVLGVMLPFFVVGLAFFFGIFRKLTNQDVNRGDGGMEPEDTPKMES